MKWTALVPLKQGPLQKSRLATCLTAPERVALSEAMAAHVVRCLEESQSIGDVFFLAPHALGVWHWIIDEGRGLNAELNEARSTLGTLPVLVIHADLPLLRAADVDALVQASGDEGLALAPDRYGTGTNAIAVAAGLPFRFQFGVNSFAIHRAAAPGAAVVTRRGLSHDVDLPDDLDLAVAAGLLPLAAWE